MFALVCGLCDCVRLCLLFWGESGYTCHFAVSRSLALCNLALEKNNGQLVLFIYYRCRAAASTCSLAHQIQEGQCWRNKAKGNKTREASLNVRRIIINWKMTWKVIQVSIDTSKFLPLQTGGILRPFHFYVSSSPCTRYQVICYTGNCMWCVHLEFTWADEGIVCAILVILSSAVSKRTQEISPRCVTD